jgi:hypothetical protein
MKSSYRHLTWLVLLFGCAAAPESGLRSPSNDYQPPPPNSASDGQPIGADRLSPSDKLDGGVKADDGKLNAPAPKPPEK